VTVTVSVEPPDVVSGGENSTDPVTPLHRIVPVAIPFGDELPQADVVIAARTIPPTRNTVRRFLVMFTSFLHSHEESRTAWRKRCS